MHDGSLCESHDTNIPPGTYHSTQIEAEGLACECCLKRTIIFALPQEYTHPLHHATSSRHLAGLDETDEVEP